MYVAVSHDAPGATFSQLGVFAYALEAATGELLPIVSNEGAPVRMGDGEDPLYAAIAHCAGAGGPLPHGTHLEVIAAQEHYFGTWQYRGPLNLTPEERRQGDYTNKGDGRPLHCAEHLKGLDEVLRKRGITTSGRRPVPPAEDDILRRCRNPAAKARHLMDRLFACL